MSLPITAPPPGWGQTCWWWSSLSFPSSENVNPHAPPYRIFSLGTGFWVGRVFSSKWTILFHFLPAPSFHRAPSLWARHHSNAAVEISDLQCCSIWQWLFSYGFLWVDPTSVTQLLKFADSGILLNLKTVQLLYLSALSWFCPSSSLSRTLTSMWDAFL